VYYRNIARRFFFISPDGDQVTGYLVIKRSDSDYAGPTVAHKRRYCACDPCLPSFGVRIDYVGQHAAEPLYGVRIRVVIEA